MQAKEKENFCKDSLCTAKDYFLCKYFEKTSYTLCLWFSFPNSCDCKKANEDKSS
jgi:hypothetical protein